MVDFVTKIYGYKCNVALMCSLLHCCHLIVFFLFFFLLYLVLNMTFAFPEQRSKRKAIVWYTSYK